MKKLLLILLGVLSLNNISLNAQTINSEDICNKLYNFLITKEDLIEDSLLGKPDFYIYELKSNLEYKNQITGIFRFKTLASHSSYHIFLKNENNINIVDCSQSFDKMMVQVLKYFKGNNDFSKDDILIYLEKLIEIYESNENAYIWIDE